MLNTTLFRPQGGTAQFSAKIWYAFRASAESVEQQRYSTYKRHEFKQASIWKAELGLMIVGAVFLCVPEAVWLRAAGGSAFIFGFLMSALDLMRISINRGKQSQTCLDGRRMAASSLIP